MWLFTPWTMKSSQGPIRALDVELVLGPLWFTPRGNVRVTMKVKVPKYIIQGLHNPLTWSTGVCGERGKRGGMVEKGRSPWQRNVVITKS